MPRNTGKQSCKECRVVCAIIERRGRILITQRGPKMARAGSWEFPGGKLKSRESHRAGIIREIREELGLRVEPFRRLKTVRHAYRDLTVRLIPMVCRVRGGRLRLVEHRAARWVLPRGAGNLKWSPADRPVWKAYLSCRGRGL